MSEGSTIMVSMNELVNQIKLAHKALVQAIADEEASDYEIELTMERKYCEGFLEALEFIYILQNGHEFNDED